MLIILFFSVDHGTGDVICTSLRSVHHGVPTITIASQAILSSVISEILTLNVQDFLIWIHLENIFIH
jgi:hypothetical protein